MQILKDILHEGTEGDAEAFLSWCRMFSELSQLELPDKFSTFKDKFESSFASRKKVYTTESSGLDLKYISAYFENQISQNKLKTERVNNRNKFLMADMSSCRFNSPDHREVVFLSNLLQHEPIYYIRSKVKNWFRFQEINEDDTLEVCIAVTEAVENAIKYSDKPPIIVDHSLHNKCYELTMYNSVKKLSKGLSENAFSQGASLMRGILIMSKIFHDFDVDRDYDNNIVILKAKIKLD